jgi:SNF2 family DNA or RNA helicase
MNTSVNFFNFNKAGEDMSFFPSITETRSLSTNQTTYQRGRAYFNSGRVEEVQFDPSYPAYNAVVVGRGDTYEVIVYANTSDAQCSCPAFFAYEGYCKHIVAVLLYLNEHYRTEQPSSRRSYTALHQHNQAMNHIINLFQNNLLQTPSRAATSPLEVQYVLGLMPSEERGSNINMLLTVQLKIGSGRLYVVKNMYNFLSAFKQQNTLVFSKNFTYDPAIHRPAAEDEAMLRFLLILFNNEQLYKRMLSPWFAARAHERMLVIPPDEIEEFLRLLPDGHYIFEHHKEQYRELPIIENECPISFFLNKQKENFSLQSEHGQTEPVPNHKPRHATPSYSTAPELALLSENGHCFVAGKMYKLNRVQRELLLPLHRQIQQEAGQKLFISAQQMGDFASIVLPFLQKEGRLTIDPHISNKIAQYPLKPRIYLDYKQATGTKERLTAEIALAYGEITIDPLENDVKNNPHEVILIRDTEKEQQIMSIFEDSNFKYNGQELYMDDEESLYHFLHKQIPQLEELADIYTTDSTQHMLMQTKHQPITRVNIDTSTNWLEVQFELPDVDEQELQNILKAFIDKRSYYRLPDGSFVSLQNSSTASLHSLLEGGAERQSVLEGHKLKLPAYRALQFEELLEGSNETTLKKGQRFRQLIRNIKNPENLEFPLPDAMTSILRDYQSFGFQWMKMLAHYRFGGILADDMGLGKTVQALTFITSELEKGSANATPAADSSAQKQKRAPALVVTQASLIYNWEKECARFAPQLKTTLVAGSREERQALLQNMTDTDVLITSYPLLRRDIDLYKPYFFQTLILDEAQSFKNQQSQTAQSVKRIRAETCFALSGTPIENSLDELWSIFDVILPGFFPSQQMFRKLPADRIAQRVRPFILRRLKRDVLRELPDKIESIHFSELTTEQKKLYLATLKKIQTDTKQLLQTDTFQKNRMKILAGLTRLRQICCHPLLYVENYTADSGKLNQFYESLEELLQNGHRVLVFSQFTSMLTLIQERLQAEKIAFHYLDGRTPSKERLELVDRFNRGEKDLFLISLRAGGTGLNLTGADTVILYDLWWNPAVEQQAADRAHRIGQKKVVQVIKLIAKGTIEEKIHELQQKKQALFDQVIQPGEQMLSTMSEADILELLDL